MKKILLLFGLPGSGKSTISNEIKKTTNNIYFSKVSEWIRKDSLFLHNNKSIADVYNARIISNKNYWSDLLINDLKLINKSIIVVESTHAINEFIKIRNTLDNVLLVGIFPSLKCLLNRVNSKDTTTEDKTKKIEYINEHFDKCKKIESYEHFDYIFYEQKTTEILPYLIDLGDL